MEVVFTSKNKLFFENFTKIFCSEKDFSVFYDDILEFLFNIISKRNSPDIIIIDGTFFGGFKKFIFRLAEDFEQKIPVVFLDPSVPQKSRRAKWLEEIELCFDNPDFHNLIPLLEKIDRILNIPSCAEFLEENIEKPSEPKEILKLKSKPRLSPLNNQLYEYFFNNRKRIVYLEEIADILEIRRDDKICSWNDVYAYVSRFRKSIAVANCGYELLRICKGGYQLVLKR